MTVITGGLLSGTASMTLDGVTTEVVGGLEWSSTTVVRENLKGMSTNSAGFKETPQQCFIQVTGRDMANTPLSYYQGMTGVTITVVLASGKTLTGANFFLTEAVTVESENATMRLRFEGGLLTELTT